MKKILFAMAFLAALASCQKADLAEQNSVNTNGERVITAYFDNAGTKTTLDGVTPKWEPNDEIMLLNGSTHDKITLGESNISADGKSITFTTTLSGPLYAVYPLDATDADRIVTENIVPVTLKAEQDGTFGSANICVAKEDDGKLAFKNVTSVLHLTQTASTGVNEIIITTPSADIAGTGTVDMSATTPALELISGKSKKIKVKSASVKSEYYIAVAPTILPEGTAFGFATGSELGGTNLSEEKTIAANTIYNIGSMDESELGSNKYHEYVEIGGLKWATMNVGATSATEAGKYFMWGETTGITPSGSSFSFPDPKYYSADNDSWNYTKGFAWENCPWTNDTFTSSPSKKNVFTKYVSSAKTDYWGGTGSPDGKTTLDLADDAATAENPNWRMPTKDDFVRLVGSCVLMWTSNYNNTSKAGYIVYEAKNDADTDKGKACMSNNTWKMWDATQSKYVDNTDTEPTGYSTSTDVHIFLPVTGYGTTTTLNVFSTTGGYWTSTLYENYNNQAFCFMFSNTMITNIIAPSNRINGYSIRPVSDL